jgi:hypothetical protein
MAPKAGVEIKANKKIRLTEVFTKRFMMGLPVDVLMDPLRRFH